MAQSLASQKPDIYLQKSLVRKRQIIRRRRRQHQVGCSYGSSLQWSSAFATSCCCLGLSSNQIFSISLTHHENAAPTTQPPHTLTSTQTYSINDITTTTSYHQIQQPQTSAFAARQTGRNYQRQRHQAKLQYYVLARVLA